MMKNSKIIAFLILLMSLSACMQDYKIWETEAPTIEPSQGIFILNEGNFMYNNASLSYYDFATKKVLNDVFFNVNKLPLGDVAQSITVYDNLAYIVINNSGKIYAIDINTFKYKGKIIGLDSPRYMLFLSETKAYVSNLYGKNITIVNPKTFKITGKIDVNNNADFNQHSTEQMLKFGKYVFVNCWSYDNQLLVIEDNTDEVIDSIKVLKQPNSMVLDRYGKLWVLSDGGYKGSPYQQGRGGLTCIDAKTRKVEKTFLCDLNDNPRSLAINGSRDTIYFVNKHVYRHAVFSNSPPELFVKAPHTESFQGGGYSLAIDPYSSEIYIADAIDFVQKGVVYKFRSDATPLDTFRVGIIPGSFCFKH